MVDLNAIPASAIDRIEILRDGAAAQYGSDAIAGVINIILKEGAPNEVQATVGQTYEADGGAVQAPATTRFPWARTGCFSSPPSTGTAAPRTVRRPTCGPSTSRAIRETAIRRSTG